MKKVYKIMVSEIRGSGRFFGVIDVGPCSQFHVEGSWDVKGFTKILNKVEITCGDIIILKRNGEFSRVIDDSRFDIDGLKLQIAVMVEMSGHLETLKSSPRHYDTF